MVERYVVFDCIANMDVSDPLHWEAAHHEMAKRLEMLTSLRFKGRFRIDCVYTNEVDDFYENTR